MKTIIYEQKPLFSNQINYDPHKGVESPIDQAMLLEEEILLHRAVLNCKAARLGIQSEEVLLYSASLDQLLLQQMRNG